MFESITIIAEIGQNHNGDMGVAADLIHSAKENGADFAKFQVYNARALFLKEGNEWFDYNCNTELSRDQVYYLAEQCKHAGIRFMASVFDVERIAWLEEAGVSCHKIASRSIHDSNLIEALSATGKPIIASLGMWKEPELPEIHSLGGVEFLYCISKYPTPLKELKLGAVDFTKYAGFSDHTVGTHAALTALARGARILEKHFTLDKAMYGPDHAGSMTPEELSAIHFFRKDLTQCL